MADPVIQTVALGPQWPTVDPFLFCAHHHDAYPAANERFGPRASLAGRRIGADFAGVDGWNMYHGREVPGFPQHPHRGFETITYVRRGLVDHADSLGAAARYGRGDVQWMTAGAGIVHAEMFPLLDGVGPNPLELFQIWLNLPSDDKLVEAHFTMLWDHTIPRVEAIDDDGRRTEITVIAGKLGDATAPAPPPASWAGRDDSDVAIWHIALEPGARWTLPPAANPASVRTLYLFEGPAVELGGRALEGYVGALLRSEEPLVLHAARGAELLLLQGRPIGEPVARYGPFVMNDRAGIERAFADYEATGFGGWPWPGDDPVNGADPDRFARHADGRLEHAGS